MKSTTNGDFENSTGSPSGSHSISSLDKIDCGVELPLEHDCTNDNENLGAMDTTDDINVELKTTEKTNDIFQIGCNTMDVIDDEKQIDFEEGIEHVFILLDKCSEK